MSHAVIDLHCDSVYSLSAGRDLRLSNPGCHVDLPRLKKGRVGCQVFAAFVPSFLDPAAAFDFASEKLDLIDSFARSDPALAPVETAKDIRAVLGLGKTGILPAVENGHAIGFSPGGEQESLRRLEAFRRRGVRIMTLVHGKHLPWIASATGPGPFPRPWPGGGAGLSPFGGRVIDAMNDLGIMVDLSHSSEGAFWDVLGRSKRPVIASHSCAYALCASSRNLTDDQLKALGGSGGVAGVNFFSVFLSETCRRRMEEDCSVLVEEAEGTEEAFRRAGTSYDDPAYRSARNRADRRLAERLEGLEAPFSLVADHIEYMVKTAGEDAVALGSDFDGIFAAPRGITGCDVYPRLEEDLRRRDFSEERIEKIFSGNFLRVLEAWDR
ncbi:MAG: dipeptidase [Treponema sp.]|jgi:membrane dipeptidase|nr:dipeptidase [Treponema sp.]